MILQKLKSCLSWFILEISVDCTIIVFLKHVFVSGSLNDPTKKSVGMLDLGGGSTQITFQQNTQVIIQVPLI